MAGREVCTQGTKLAECVTHLVAVLQWLALVTSHEARKAPNV